MSTIKRCLAAVGPSISISLYLAILYEYDTFIHTYQHNIVYVYTRGRVCVFIQDVCSCVTSVDVTKVLQVGVWTHPSVFCFDVSCFTDVTLSKGLTYNYWLVILLFKLVRSLKWFNVKISGCSLRKKQLICQLDGRGPRMRDEILVIWPK